MPNCKIYNNGERKSDEKWSKDSKSYEQKIELQFIASASFTNFYKKKYSNDLQGFYLLVLLCKAEEELHTWLLVI